MKPKHNISIVMITALFIFSFNFTQAVTITKLGKGGVVFQPGGTYKLCPQFALKKCCTITLTWKDIWNWLNEGGCWNDDINSALPLHGSAVLYDDNGLQVGTYDAQIIWINPFSCAEISGDEIIMSHPDVQIEATQ